MNESRLNLSSTATRTVAVAFIAFIGLGLTNGLIGLAWPSMRTEFGLALDAVNILYLMQTAAYTLASFFIGRLMTRFGSGTTLLVGMTLMALSMFGIATASTWALVVVFSLIFGLGSGIVDAGLNMYLATYHGPRQMNWLHACFGIGITIGPLIMTFALRQRVGWHLGYAIVGMSLLIVILLFAFTRNLWRREGLQTAENKPVRRASFAQTLRVPAVWFSMATFFAYVAVEIGIGQWAYTLMTESRSIDPQIAGLWVAIYWGVFTGGRILFGVAANRFEIDHVLRVCMLGMIAGAALFWWNPVNAVGFIGLLIVGGAQAPVFPMLMTGTVRRVGTIHAENGIGLQMAAVGIGAAILPGLIGTIGKDFGLETMTFVFAFMAVIVFICHELTLIRHADDPVPQPAGD